MKMEDFISVYRATSEVYINAKCLLVEYFDMLALPWYNVLQLAVLNEDMRHIYTFDEFTEDDPAEILEWYAGRKYRDVFKSLHIRDGVQIGKDFTTNIMKELCLMDKSTFLAGIRLAPHYALEALLKTNKGIATSNPMVKKVIIYTEYEVPYINEYIEHFFGDVGVIEYKWGDFKEVIKDIPQDSTYMLSDITKMKILEETGKLSYASVVLPANYRYNKGDDGDFLYNFKEMQDKTVFKCDSIDVFNVT